MVFNQRHPLWHVIGSGFNFNQLGNPRQVEQLRLGAVNRMFAGMFHRSGLIQVEADGRSPHQGGTREAMPWCDWVRYALVQPSLPRTVPLTNGRFVIACLSLESGELKLCAEPRSVRHGLFALRLSSVKQHVFLLSECPASLTHEGCFGNGVKPKVQSRFDLY
jgi:hypothetical protein